MLSRFVARIRNAGVFNFFLGLTVAGLVIVFFAFVGKWSPISLKYHSRAAESSPSQKDSHTSRNAASSKNESPVAGSSSSSTAPATVAQNTQPAPAPPQQRAPTDNKPIFPITKDASIACGHWPSGSLDYPYFGAPRSNGRLHGGVDIYPGNGGAPDGGGSPVYAIKDGKVAKIIDGFLVRQSTGESTKAVIVDHGDFMGFYGEIRGNPTSPGASLSLAEGQSVGKGTVLGYISGTEQLHFEMYTPGTTAWVQWYGAQPSNLLDPTGFITTLYGI